MLVGSVKKYLKERNESLAEVKMCIVGENGGSLRENAWFWVWLRG